MEGLAGQLDALAPVLRVVHLQRWPEVLEGLQDALEEAHGVPTQDLFVGEAGNVPDWELGREESHLIQTPIIPVCETQMVQ